MSEPSSDPSGIPPLSDSDLPENPPPKTLATHEGQGGDGASPDPAAEQPLWQGRTDWRYFAGRCALAVVGLIVAWIIVGYAAARTSMSGWSAFIICLLLTALTVVGVGGWVMLQIIRTRYRLTDQRLFIERGVFAQTIDQIELIRVDDVRLKKKFIDRFFGIGSIELLTTDTSDTHLIIDGVAKPEEIAEHIRTRMRELRSRSLFIENL